MKQQTAVDYLVKLYYTEYDILLPSEDYAQAKQMEKEQIVKAHGLKYYDLNEETINGEQYYNETYKKQ